jgi:hypothetical protein
MMRRPILLGAIALAALGVPCQAQAQLGVVLEWVNKLSGPGLWRLGPEIPIARVDDRNRVNLAPLFKVSVDTHANAATEAADIFAFGVQATLESTLIGQPGAAELRSKIGFEVHNFSGEFDSFWAPSFPMLLALHVPVGGGAFEIGTGFQVFSFPDDAFAPFDVGVETDGFDAGWTIQVAFEVGTFALID